MVLLLLIINRRCKWACPFVEATVRNWTTHLDQYQMCQRQIVKTQGSKKTTSIARELLERLRLWKQCSQFRADTDWVFVNPMKIDRLPYSCTGVRRTLQRAADAAGIGKLTTHAFCHSFRTWLNQTGAPIATQQKLMRHSSLAMTVDIHGTRFDAELTAASEQGC